MDFKKFVSEVSESLKRVKAGVLIRLSVLEKNDRVFKRVKKILKENIRKTDMLCEVKENGFVIFIELSDKKHASKIGERIYRLFIYPVEGIMVFINAGISIYPSDGNTFEELFEKAGTALKEAIKEGPDLIKFYNQTLEKEKTESSKIEMLIERAIKENLFTYFYQPFFETKNLKIAGFEALLRIVEKDGKVHPAGNFIHVLEKHPYINILEKKLLKEAIRNSRKWELPVAINLSEKGFITGSFLKYFITHCESECKIIIELVERMFIQSPVHYVDILEKLKDIGLKIAIDDFGAGYSLLAYLKELPFDILKIDKSFTRYLPHNRRARAVVELIILLSKKLGVKVCVEGIERENQLEFVRKINCDYVQGFLFSKPLPEKKVENFFINNKY